MTANPRLVVAVLFALVGLALPGCRDSKVEREAPPAPPPSYTGPEFMKTSVGSMTFVRGYTPTLVSGYGLVVDLQGTGSNIVPAGLREMLLNDMARMGMGRGEYADLKPDVVLNSTTSAVVAVEGIIRPGATRGTRFDVQVAAIPGTDVVSLQGGRLFTTELRVNGLNLAAPSRASIASARGPIFINPFAEQEAGAGSIVDVGDDPRVGRILGGGHVNSDQPIGLQLNQPSYQRSRAIADRINSRFPPGPRDRTPLAVAKTPEYIELNILQRFRSDPLRMLELISAMFLNPTQQFNEQKARQLLQVVEASGEPEYVRQAVVAWEAMGRMSLPVVREAYGHADPRVAIAALEAGARLGDMKTADPLIALARGGPAEIRDRATHLVGVLLTQRPDNIRLAQTLRDLLDANDALVRFAAFDALAKAGDPAIRYRPFGEKVELAMAPSDKPMIYVSRHERPRIVMFDPVLAFRRPMVFSYDWPNDERLMLRLDDDDALLSVYYKAPRARAGRTFQIAPAVANLVYLMAHRPEGEDINPGLDMPYTKIVELLHALTTEGEVTAPLVLQPSDLNESIVALKSEPAAGRPETAASNDAIDAAESGEFVPLQPTSPD